MACIKCNWSEHCEHCKKHINELVHWLTGQRETANKRLAKFGADLVEDPAYSMDWADSAFAAAAYTQIFGKVIDAFTGENSKATLRSVHEYALREILTKASSPQRSTSVSSNFLEQQIIAAWVAVYKYVDDILKELKT